MHPSLIEKPVFTVADLHLIAKLAIWTEDDTLTLAEGSRLDALSDVLDDYLTVAVGYDWPLLEALV